MSDGNPFAGIKLSEPAKGVTPTPVTPVDQRLFSSTPTPTPSLPAPEPASKPQAPIAAAPAEKREVGKEGKREAVRPAWPREDRAATAFDINVSPWRKDSFLFTDGEFERLDDLKLELRRRYDVKATKNDIARIAFQLVFEDYRAEGAKSAVVRQLRKKKP